jgi:membrane glycosyltransferase
MICLSLDNHFEGHDTIVIGIADIFEAHTTESPVVCFGGRLGGAVDMSHVLLTRERIAAVTMALFLQVFLVIALNERHLVMGGLVMVIGFALVDVPQKQTTPNCFAEREVRVAALLLPILHEEVLRLRLAARPELQDFVRVLHIAKLDPVRKSQGQHASRR